ncbi:MAG: TIGR03936 family radical SAM-associated protein [Clostridia bacterium]
MIILKYVKKGNLSYVSHKDIVRVLQRGLKRANIDVAYSLGYIPHMLTYTTTPLPLGAQSDAEYFVIDCPNLDGEAFLESYNKAMPTELGGIYAVYREKNPNLANYVVASEYVAVNNNEKIFDINEILQAKEYLIPVKKKDEIEEKDIRDMIFDISRDGDKLRFVLATGNVNLRVDNFIYHLNEKFGTQYHLNNVCRAQQLVMRDNSLISVEEFIK